MAEPKIRFKQDNGENYPAWERISVNDIGTFYNGLSGKNKDDFNHGNGKFITYMNVYKNEFASLDMLGKVSVSDNEKQFLIQYGDIIFTQSSETMEEVGLSSVWLHRDRFFVNSFCMILRPYDFNKILPEFLGYLFRNPKTRKKIISFGQGFTRVNLSSSRLGKVNFNYPCKKEQQKIADFLSSVDEVITTSEQEVANLEMQKKAVMKKIFSQEVRFEKDDGSDFPDWEEKIIEETCDCLDNMRKPITKSDRKSGPYPYYGSTNIQDYVAGYIFDEPLVLLAEDAGPFMEFWDKPIAQWAEGKFWVNNHAHVLRPYGNRKFMFYQLEHKDIREFINNPGRGKLNQEDMKNIVVYIPCLEEQKLIADFLSDFDEAITLAKKELELWKQMKKGLLQQMFI